MVFSVSRDNDGPPPRRDIDPFRCEHFYRNDISQGEKLRYHFFRTSNAQLISQRRHPLFTPEIVSDKKPESGSVGSPIKSSSKKRQVERQVERQLSTFFLTFYLTFYLTFLT